LWNNSAQDYTDIDYAFPVDYEGGGEEYVNSGLIGDYYSEGSYTLGWHDDYVKKIAFFMDGEALPYKRSEEVILEMYDPISEEDKKNMLEEGEDVYEFYLNLSKAPAVCRRWFYTQFSIKAYQSVTLEVHYALRNTQAKSTYSSNFDTSGNQCELYYDFSPAEYWGDGTARDFTVQIDASDLAVVPNFYDDKYNISIEGLPFTRAGNVYVYSTQHFSFKNAEKLAINYILLNSIDLSNLLKQQIPKNQYTILASSEQKNYPVSNLTDMDFATAYVPATKGGLGEKIVIQFKEPTKVNELVIVNGYHKNEKTYLENNRIKNIVVIAEGNSYWKNEAGKVIIDDEKRELTLSYDVNNAYIPIHLDQLKFHPDVSATTIAHTFDSFKTTKIELTITEIYPGTKYNDTCISEIILLEQEHKKYKID
jgi:hypothetical protein